MLLRARVIAGYHWDESCCCSETGWSSGWTEHLQALEFQASAYLSALSEGRPTGSLGVTMVPVTWGQLHSSAVSSWDQEATPRATILNHCVNIFKGSDNKAYRCVKAHLWETQSFSLTLLPDFLTTGPHFGSGLGCSSCGIGVWGSLLATANPWWGRMQYAHICGKTVLKRLKSSASPSSLLQKPCVAAILAQSWPPFILLMYQSVKGRTNEKISLSDHKSGGH